MAPEPFDAIGVVPSTTWLFWSILSFERHANELRIRPLSTRSSLVPGLRKAAAARLLYGEKPTKRRWNPQFQYCPGQYWP